MIKLLLTESKVDNEYERNYSDIDREVFETIIRLDPKTLVVNDEVVNIGFGAKQLLLTRYKAGDKDFINHPEQITDALNTFYENMKSYPAQFKNLSSYKSIEDFIRFVNGETVELSQETASNKIKDIYDKYYSDIDINDFEKIIALDPQTTDSKIGEVAKNLLLDKFRKGEKDFLTNDKRVITAIKDFYALKSGFAKDKQQINNYASVEEFVNFMEAGNDSSLVSSLKQNTTVDPKTLKQVKDDVNFIASTRDYDILEPKSHRANYAISGGWNSANGMHWCTGWDPEPSSENDYHFNNYTSNGNRLVCFMNKLHNRGTEYRPINWQIQINPEGIVTEFLDGSDRTVSFAGGSRNEQFKNFLLAYPNIALAIKDKDPFKNSSAVIEATAQIRYSDEPFSLNTDDDVITLRKSNLKTILKELHVKIPKIPSGLFAEYSALREVHLEQGVKEVGNEAFKNCVSLNTLSFSEGLEVIGYEAFTGCIALRNTIKLPNSLKEIRTRAFDDTHCKLSIDKNRKEKLKMDASDIDWIKAHVKGIQVK